MSYQDKLSQATARLRRTLFDYKVGITGTTTQVVRLKVVINQYQDKEYTIINHDLVPFVIKLPESIPMTRLRSLTNPNNTTDEQDANTANVFLYDILPIEGFSRFSDDVERGDIIVKKVYADDDNADPYLFILQITETMGNIDQENIVWKKHYCAPTTMTIPEDILTIISEYETELF